jgi:hypothetical protein
MPVAKGHIITDADKAAFVKYIADNLEVGVSEKNGTQFLTVPGYNAEFGGLSGAIRVSFYGIRETAETKERITKRITADVDKLTPEEKQALLERLL